MPVAINQVSQTRVTYTSGGSNDTFTHTFDAGTGSDRLLVVGIRPESGGAVTLVKYGGVDCTFVDDQGGLDIWRLPAHATGSNALTWTATGEAFGRCYVAAATFTGANQTPTSTAVKNSGASAGSGTRTTGSVTCPTDGMVWGVVTEDYTDADVTASTGTLLGQHRNGRAIGHATRNSTGAIVFESSNYAFAWQAIGLPIEPAGGGGGGLSPTFRRAFNPAILNL